MASSNAFPSRVANSGLQRSHSMTLMSLSHLRLHFTNKRENNKRNWNKFSISIVSVSSARIFCVINYKGQSIVSTRRPSALRIVPESMRTFNSAGGVFCGKKLKFDEKMLKVCGQHNLLIVLEVGVAVGTITKNRWSHPLASILHFYSTTG